MGKKILLIVALMAILSSCASMGLVSYDSKVKNLQLGMSKKEAVKVMGNSYRVINAVATPDGDLETISYVSGVSYNYTLNFLDGRLVEWFDELVDQGRHRH